MKKSALSEFALDQGGQTWAQAAPADLKGLISGYLGRRSKTNCERFTIFPNARIELLFNFGSPYLTSPHSEAPLQPLSDATFFAPKIGRNEHQCGPIVDWFLVQLSLSGCLSILGTSGADVLQTDRPLADFIGDEAFDLHFKLRQQSIFSARSAIFSQWARRRLAPVQTAHRISSFCELARTQVFRSVREAAHRCGIGERRLRDCFMAEVGVRPKTWLSIVRAERLWTALHSGTSRNFAPFAEFSDESHAHREFKRWTGVTIGEFQAIKRMGDGLVNGGQRLILS